jgi:RNA 3'-terminal phosphate cyclase (ATP)
MLEIDGSLHSGSGTIVRQAVAFSAMTGQPVHIVNARTGRPNPGLRPQHVRVVEAIRELVNGTAQGAREGSQELVFIPGAANTRRQFAWDIGTAGSTTLLALAVMPLLAFGSSQMEIEIRGGLFQDFAPSFYHLAHVVAPLLGRMGLDSQVKLERVGYAPRGGGVLRLSATPVNGALQPLVMTQRGDVKRIWGVALSSRLQERQVSERMAEAAARAFSRAGFDAQIEARNDATSLHTGAALAAFADLEGDPPVRLGADMAGAPGRRAEAIGERVAQSLLEDLRTGATLDRYAADQIIPFAALAEGTSRFLIPQPTDHIESGAWLAKEFLGAEVKIHGQTLEVEGVGFRRS